jgi:hypothetical protein
VSVTLHAENLRVCLAFGGIEKSKNIIALSTN